MTIRINLALQGGGAHGAFTWGVLDRLLEEEDIEVAAISGTSAGALNGAAFKSGWLRGGREGARENLDWLWAQMGALNDLRLPHWMTGFLPSPAHVASAMSNVWAASMGDAVTRMTTPYNYGPLYSNPLKDVVDQFHYEHVCAQDGPQLFVGATNVHTGKIRIFSGADINTDAILASACLPTLFKAIEIEDPASSEIVPYWDGGYSGNPALFPLFDRALPDDILIVNLNPLERKALPVSAQEIQNRINEISFNSSLLRELRAIEFVQRLITDGRVARGQMKQVLVHMVGDDEFMRGLSETTKMMPNPYLLASLKAAGRKAADDFLDAHREALGRTSSVDLRAMFG